MKATVAITKMFWEDEYVQDYIHFIVNQRNGFDDYTRKIKSRRNRNFEMYLNRFLIKHEWLMCCLVDALESKELN